MLLSVLTLLAARSSPVESDVLNEVIKELKLSIPDEEIGRLETNDIDVEFEILSGNGEYVASVSHTDGGLAVVRVRIR